MTLGKDFFAGFMLGAWIVYLWTLSRQQTPPDRESAQYEWRQPLKKTGTG